MHAAQAVRFFMILLLTFGITACGPLELSDDTDKNNAASSIFIMGKSGMTRVPKDQVITVQVTIFPTRAGSSSENKVAIFNGADGVKILEAVGIHTPQNVGRAAAIRTGEVRVMYGSDLKEIKEKSFHVLNGRILEDADHPDFSYRSPVNIDALWLDQSLKTIKK